jgi:hypothetical protein
VRKTVTKNPDVDSQREIQAFLTSKVKVAIVVLGEPLPSLDTRRITNWKSTIIEFDPEIRSFPLRQNAGGSEWEYTDEQLSAFVPDVNGANLVIAIVRVKLQENYLLRRLTQNRVVLTVYQLDEFFASDAVPIANYVLRMIYPVVVAMKRFGRIPETSERRYTHDETRGCIFDMLAWKSDIRHSINKPKICSNCFADINHDGLAVEDVTAITKELERIRPPLFNRIICFVREHTLWSIVLSIGSAFVIGIIASLAASYIFKWLTG